MAERSGKPAYLSQCAGEIESQELSAFSRSKRQKILKAAIELFLSEGYAATSMNRVASLSGVTKQTIYSHFQDKEGLFAALIEELTLKRFGDRFDGKPLSGEPEAVLRSFAEVMIKLQKDKQFISLYRTIIAESARFPELAQLFVKTVIKRGINLLSAYFDTHPELNIADSQATARIFCGSLVAFLISQHILHGQEIIPFQAERLVDSLISHIIVD